MKVDYIEAGLTVPSYKTPEVQPFFIPFRKYACVYLIAQPRYGKGGLAKHLVVKLSHHRPLCIFDFKGEWSRHVTHPNHHSRHPDFISEYKVYRNFTFKLEEFKASEDWMSMGFLRAEEIRNIFLDTMSFHQGMPDDFMQILSNLPTETKGSMTIEEFNTMFRVNLPISVHAETKRAWVRTFQRVKGWFWYPGDSREIYNFGEEWLKHKHIFIDFTTEGHQDFSVKHRNRTMFGKIMEKLQAYFVKIQGMLIIEEADHLLPKVTNTDGLKPSSNLQMIHFVAKAPKEGMGCMMIMQHLKQSDEDIRIGGQFMWLMGLCTNYPYPFQASKAPKLWYFPERNYREFLFIDVNNNWQKFVPGIPCCEYESNIDGGMDL